MNVTFYIKKWILTSVSVSPKSSLFLFSEAEHWLGERCQAWLWPLLTALLLWLLVASSGVGGPQTNLNSRVAANQSSVFGSVIWFPWAPFWCYWRGHEVGGWGCELRWKLCGFSPDSTLIPVHRPGPDPCLSGPQFHCLFNGDSGSNSPMDFFVRIKWIYVQSTKAVLTHSALQW